MEVDFVCVPLVQGGNSDVWKTLLGYRVGCDCDVLGMGPCQFVHSLA